MRLLEEISASLRRSAPGLRFYMSKALLIAAVVFAFGAAVSGVVLWQKLDDPTVPTYPRLWLLAFSVGAALAALIVGWSATAFQSRIAWLVGSGVLLLVGIVIVVISPDKGPASGPFILLLGVARLLWGVEPSEDDRAGTPDTRDNEPRIRA